MLSHSLPQASRDSWRSCSTKRIRSLISGVVEIRQQVVQDEHSVVELTHRRAQIAIHHQSIRLLLPFGREQRGNCVKNGTRYLERPVGIVSVFPSGASSIELRRDREISI